MTWITEYAFSTDMVSKILGVRKDDLDEAIFSQELDWSCFFAGCDKRVPNHHTFCDVATYICSVLLASQAPEYYFDLDEVLDCFTRLEEDAELLYKLSIANGRSDVLSISLAKHLGLPETPTRLDDKEAYADLLLVADVWINLYIRFEEAMQFEILCLENGLPLERANFMPAAGKSIRVARLVKLAGYFSDGFRCHTLWD